MVYFTIRPAQQLSAPEQNTIVYSLIDKHMNGSRLNVLPPVLSLLFSYIFFFQKATRNVYTQIDFQRKKLILPSGVLSSYTCMQITSYR